MLFEDRFKGVRDDFTLALACVIGQSCQFSVILFRLSLSIISIVVIIVVLVFILGAEHEVLADSQFMV